MNAVLDARDGCRDRLRANQRHRRGERFQYGSLRASARWQRQADGSGPAQLKAYVVDLMEDADASVPRRRAECRPYRG